MKLFILVIFLITSRSYAIRPPGVANEPSDYLFLTKNQNQDQHFKRGSLLKMLPSGLCKELNNTHTGKVINLKKEKSDISLKFMLQCDNRIGRHKISFSFQPSKEDAVINTIEVLGIYEEDSEIYSFLSERYYLKIHRWNGFNERLGVMRLLIFDKFQNDVITSLKPLKVSEDRK